MQKNLQAYVQDVLDATVGQGLTIGGALEVIEASRQAILSVILRPEPAQPDTAPERTTA